MSESHAQGGRLLPEPFGDLEKFAPLWALPTALARSEQRSRSAMAEMAAFHDAMFARLEDILAHLEQYPLNAMPDDARRLLCLSLSLAEVCPFVYFYKEERPAHIIDPKRVELWPVQNMTPLL
jgi:hypothetical protein